MTIVSASAIEEGLLALSPLLHKASHCRSGFPMSSTRAIGSVDSHLESPYLKILLL